MALGVILLVDLDDSRDRVELGAVLAAERVFEALLSPVGEDLLPEGDHVLGADVELVLRSGGKPLDLLVDPGDPGLGEDDAGPDAARPVADDELLRVDTDIDPAHRLGQGQGALDGHGRTLMELVDFRDDEGLLDGEEARLIQQVLLQLEDARGRLQLADDLTDTAGRVRIQGGHHWATSSLMTLSAPPARKNPATWPDGEQE